MATLEGQSIASSYEQLLHVDRDGGGNTTTLVDVKDGDNGTTFALKLAQYHAEIRGTVGTGATGAGKLNLATAELTVVDDDVLGRIDFLAPLESSGTDAILAGASIWGEAEDAFANDNNSTALVFATNTSAAATERMRLTSAGNLDLGDSLKIELGASQDLQLYHDGSNSYIDHGVGNLTGDLKIRSQRHNGDIVFSVEDSGGTARNALQLTAVGTANFIGDVVISTSGKGISFAATADGGVSTPSELLDDYEEGTWTPAFNGHTGSAGTAATTSTSATYTKIGNLVTAQCAGVSPSNWPGSYTGNLGLAGLPFTVAGTESFIPVAFYDTWNHDGSMTQLSYNPGSGGTGGGFRESFDNASGAYTAVGDISTSTSIGFAFSYLAA